MKIRKKIKIAFIIDTIDSFSGTEKQVIKLIELLDQNLFRTALICLRPPIYHMNLDVLKAMYVEMNIRSIISIHGITSIISLANYLRRNKYDIVQTYFTDSSIVGVIAARLAGIKKVICSKRDLGFWYTPDLLRILRIVNRLVYRFLANSNSVKDVLIKNERVLPQKIDVIYNGIEMAPFEVSYDKNEWKKKFRIRTDYVVGILANFSRPVKKIDVFIRAAAQVLNKIDNVTFIIVGDGGELQDEMEKLTKQLKIENNVIFTGVQKNVSPVLSFWDIGVISSDSEGFSNTILEYMASGIPVVATATGGNCEVIEDDITGMLVSPGDYYQLAERIIKLLNNEKKKIRISERANIVIRKKYDWKIKIMEFEDYYISL